MKRGRPSKKSALVDAIAGPDATRERLRVILATVSGELTIPQACEKLKIGETRFYDLRAQALEAAFKGILPKEPGRPAKEETPEQARLKEMQQRLDAMELELKTAKIKAELTQAMAAGKEPPPAQKKRRHPRNRYLEGR